MVGVNRDRTVQCPLSLWGLKTPEAPFIILKQAFLGKPAGGFLSYLEADTLISKASISLGSLLTSQPTWRRRGLNPIAFFPRSDPYSVLFFFLCLRLNLVCVPFSPHYTKELASDLLEDLEPISFIHYRDSPKQANGKQLVWEDFFPQSLPVKLRRPKEALPSYRLDQLANVIFTSGSTGRPKAVGHAYGNHYYSAQGSQEIIPLSQESCWLLDLPLYHIGALAILHRVSTFGASLAFELNASVTHVSWVATQLQRALKREVPFFKKKNILLGGSSVPDALVGEALAKQARMFTSYGMTEMSSQIYTVKWQKTTEGIKKKGTQLAYAEIKIGHNAEIKVKGEVLAPGIIRAGKIEAFALDGDGFYATKDLGSMDSHRQLSVKGRRDNLFVSGGENIQPEWIEKTLYQCPGLKNVVVLPREHEEMGYVAVAVVDLESDATLQVLRQVSANCLRGLFRPKAYYRWPKAISEDSKMSRERLKKQLNEQKLEIL